MKTAARVALIAFVACRGDVPPVSATSWPEADALFHAEPRWLGADGAYSVDLGGGRILWLFGDTFLARSPGGTTADAYFLRNTAAVQTGRDPSTARMQFAWGADADGGARSFVDQQGSDWFWPGGGARLGDVLVLFYSRVATPAGDPRGFQAVGWRALVVANPDADPADWTTTDARLPADDHGFFPGNAVLRSGEHLYAYAEDAAPFHDVRLARWSVAAAAQGDLSAPEWWCGDHYDEGCGSPSIVVGQGAPELSVQADGVLAPFVMFQTEGYGAATLALRTAPAPEGPWSDVQSFFRPPESRDDSPPDVYAGKGHPGLSGADFVATYVPSDLYFPRFVRVNRR